MTLKNRDPTKPTKLTSPIIENLKASASKLKAIGKMNGRQVNQQSEANKTGRYHLEHLVECVTAISSGNAGYKLTENQHVVPRWGIDRRTRPLDPTRNRERRNTTN